MKVDPRHVMALRQLTDQPISFCRAALIEAGGDLISVVRYLRESLRNCYATDEQVVAAFAAHGIAYTPEVRQPVILPDNEVIAALTAGGRDTLDHFLIGGLICSENGQVGLVCMMIDDPDLAVSAVAYLRRRGVSEYPSLRAYHERDQGAR